MTERWIGIFKVIEEKDELGQILAKMCQTPDMKHWDGDLTPSLIEELTDLQQALDFFMETNNVEIDPDRYDQKRQKYQHWLELGELRGIDEPKYKVDTLD